MKVTKEEIYGYTGSGIFCLLIFIFLMLTVIRTTIKSGEEGILVNFGNVDISSGAYNQREGEPQNQTSQPQVQQPVPAPVRTTPPPAAVQQRPQQRPQNNAATPAITQNIENTAAIEAAKKEQAERNRIEAERRAQQAREQEAIRAQQAREQEVQRQRDAINQQVSGAFGSSATGQNQGGTGTTGSGIQGNPNSTSPVGSLTGTGLGEFDLKGRSLGVGGLIEPDDSVSEEGRIVVNITVNPSGNVISTSIGRGTNIENTKMRNSALAAARITKFNSVSGNNNQSGTITYNYRRR